MKAGTVASLGLAVATLALAGCGKKRAAEEHAAPPPIGLPAKPPVAPRPPRLMPTFVTLDELNGHQPGWTGVRWTAELALDASGKQALASGCVTAATAEIAMNQLADGYAAARWVIRSRTMSQGGARAELIGNFEVYGGTLHVRGVLTSTAPCQSGEVGLALSYSKVIPAPTPTAPATATPGDAPDRAAPPTTP